MDQNTLIKRLMATFLEELEEHVAARLTAISWFWRKNRTARDGRSECELCSAPRTV